jgi:SAM-dependent methyltransferase
MTLADEYRNQFRWRAWPAIFGTLPAVSGSTVLDLGCGIGDQAAELAALGARVIGVDANEALLEVARSRSIPNVEFRQEDLRSFGPLEAAVNGVWCSFAAAYFPRLGELLHSWRQLLKPGGWIALTEIDDLFGHEPMDVEAKALLSAYTDAALAADRYDLRMGRKLRGHLEGSGFLVTTTLTLEDKELSFEGPADSQVLDAWAARLERMKSLREFCGARFEHVRGQLLSALAHREHHSTARVYCCVATAEGGASAGYC